MPQKKYFASGQYEMLILVNLLLFLGNNSEILPNHYFEKNY